MPWDGRKVGGPTPPRSHRRRECSAGQATVQELSSDTCRRRPRRLAPAGPRLDKILSPDVPSPGSRPNAPGAQTGPSEPRSSGSEPKARMKTESNPDS